MKLALSTVVVAALATLVAGCGGDPVDATSGTSPATAVAEAPVAQDSAAKVPEVQTRSGLLRDLEVEQVVPPRALRVPSLGIDADVIAVGVDAQDRFDVPSAEEVGWYKFGPAPGGDGSSVLAAHVAYNGVRGAFADLGTIKTGAAVDVELSDGSVQSFRVVDVVSVAKADLAGLGAFDRSGEPLLRLVTCGGEFDAQNREYSDNVVVTAEPVV